MAITNPKTLSYSTGNLTDYNASGNIIPSTASALGFDLTLQTLRAGTGANTSKGGIPIPTAQNFFSQITSGGLVDLSGSGGLTNSFVLGSHYIYVAAVGANVILPAANSALSYHGSTAAGVQPAYGRRYLIVFAGGEGSATLRLNNGSALATLSADPFDYLSVEVISNGSTWLIINSRSTPLPLP